MYMEVRNLFVLGCGCMGGVGRGRGRANQTLTLLVVYAPISVSQLYIVENVKIGTCEGCSQATTHTATV